MSYLVCRKYSQADPNDGGHTELFQLAARVTFLTGPSRTAALFRRRQHNSVAAAVR
jgi:hypothetical protein